MSAEEIRTTPDGREVVITELPDEPLPGATMYRARFAGEDEAPDEGVTLIVRYSPYYPPDRCWMWTVTDDWRKFQGWRPTRAEAVELGLEDLLAQFAEAERRKAAYAVVDAALTRKGDQS